MTKQKSNTPTEILKNIQKDKVALKQAKKLIENKTPRTKDKSLKSVVGSNIGKVNNQTNEDESYKTEEINFEDEIRLMIIKDRSIMDMQKTYKFGIEVYQKAREDLIEEIENLDFNKDFPEYKGTKQYQKDMLRDFLNRAIKINFVNKLKSMKQ